MPICRKCTHPFPSSIMIDGERKILNSRKFCLECSPYGCHNTIKLDVTKKLIDGKTCTRCNTEKVSSEFYRRRDGMDLSSYCIPCTNNQTTERQNKLKELAVDYKGGKCIECGYDKCIAALQFHHTNPLQKDFSISHAKSTTFNKIKNELDKCVLLCSRCHIEHHWNLHRHIDDVNKYPR